MRQDKPHLTRDRQMVACVAGGIVGARNILRFDSRAAKSKRRSCEENGEEDFGISRGFAARNERLRRKNFIPHAYNTASYAG